MSDEEYDIIKAEAERLDITLANFCRWTSSYAAMALRKHREENSEQMEVEIKNGENPRVRRKPSGGN